MKLMIIINNQLTIPPQNQPIFQLRENETNCIIFKFNKKNQQLIVKYLSDLIELNYLRFN